MKKLPLSIQTFKKIIEGDYVYVDKTQYIYNLLNNLSCCFLSRPRRFGKSLLLDTIAEALGGDKELFRGLWIYDSDFAFAKHPVIRFDMSNIPNKNPETLEYSLLSELKKQAKKEDLNIDSAEPAIFFGDLIESLYEKYDQTVAILIDEYDKPILDHIDDIQIADKNRKAIRGFYGILKSKDPFLRFTMFTGVSKFTKTSLFSELNNLFDITMVEQYANICGIEVENLEKHFGEHIKALPEFMKTPGAGGKGGGNSRGIGNFGGACDKGGGGNRGGDSGSADKNGGAEVNDIGNTDNSGDDNGWLGAILSWYDGYSWDGSTRVINPFSLLSFLMQKKIGSFWYSSGSPRFLIDLLKKSPEIYVNLDNMEINESMLDSVELDKIAPEPLMFQTGYLTVKEIQQSDSWFPPVFILEIPNLEVRDAFSLHILSDFTESGQVRAGQAKIEILRALRAGDMQKMLDILRGLFASIPYELHIDKEAYYHSIFYAVMNALGFDIAAEASSPKGRVDAVLELGDKVYVMEFKYEKCPPGASGDEKKKLFDSVLTAAANQINDRGYCDRFKGSGKKIYKTAFAFLGRDEIEMRVF